MSCSRDRLEAHFSGSGLGLVSSDLILVLGLVTRGLVSISAWINYSKLCDIDAIVFKLKSDVCNYN